MSHVQAMLVTSLFVILIVLVINAFLKLPKNKQPFDLWNDDDFIDYD